jgi:hypothetical protein
VSHMRSSSVIGAVSEALVEVVGKDSHVRTSLSSCSYFDSWSAVNAGGAAGLQPCAGSGKGPIADILINSMRCGELREIQTVSLVADTKELI